MVRVLTTIWFMFFSLLGPGVCCCTLRADSPTEDSCDATTPRSCCCDEPIANEGGKPANPAPTHDCPCKRTREVAQASAATTITSTFASSWIADYVIVPWHADALAATLFGSCRTLSGANPPSHSAIDFLYACHILRC